MTTHIARAARAAAAVLTALVSAACTSAHTDSPATHPNTTPVLSAPLSPAPAFPAVVASCSNAYLGKTTATFTVRNATAAHAYVTVLVTINGHPALQLVRADDSQPEFSPKGIGLDPGQTFTGSASVPAGSDKPACTVEARAAD